MLRYLNNASTQRRNPTRIIAARFVELHTLGGEAYPGIGTTAKANTDGLPIRTSPPCPIALSGWTVEQGQDGPAGILPFTGQVPLNRCSTVAARRIMGTDLAALFRDGSGAARFGLGGIHPAHRNLHLRQTLPAHFRRHPPQGRRHPRPAAWRDHATPARPDRAGVAHILRRRQGLAQAPSKVRRPYERVIALFRTTNMELDAFGPLHAGAPLGDGILP